MSDHEPVVTRAVTITEGPNGVTRAVTASVAGGTPWEANELLNAALIETREGTDRALMSAMAADLKRLNDLAEMRRAAHAAPGSVQIVTIPNGYGRNLDMEEGA